MRAWLAALLAVASFSCFAQADYAREQRWADEITPAILVGDPVQLALPAVLDNAAKRAAAIRKIRGSAQIGVAGADPFFNGMDKELVRNVKLFLDALQNNK